MKTHIKIALISIIMLVIPSVAIATPQLGEIIDETTVYEIEELNIPLRISDPLYIGGARYQLTLADFTPIYKTRTIVLPCDTIVTRTISGYKTSIPVYGDFSQELFFDIFGNSGTKNMSLTMQCGSYSSTDSGPEYVMSQAKRTNGSCQTMDVSFASSGAASSINLTILISEDITK